MQADHEDSAIAAIHADLDRQQADDRYERERQADVDQRKGNVAVLTAEELAATVEALSRFVITAGVMLKDPRLTPAAQAAERARLLAADRASQKLTGRVA